MSPSRRGSLLSVSAERQKVLRQYADTLALQLAERLTTAYQNKRADVREWQTRFVFDERWGLSTQDETRFMCRAVGEAVKPFHADGIKKPPDSIELRINIPWSPEEMVRDCTITAKAKN